MLATQRPDPSHPKSPTASCPDPPIQLAVVFQVSGFLTTTQTTTLRSVKCDRNSLHLYLLLASRSSVSRLCNRLVHNIFQEGAHLCTACIGIDNLIPIGFHKCPHRFVILFFGFVFCLEELTFFAAIKDVVASD